MREARSRSASKSATRRRRSFEVPEHGLLRRRLLRRRGRVARLLRQVGRRAGAARSGAARGAGARAVERRAVRRRRTARWRRNLVLRLMRDRDASPRRSCRWRRRPSIAAPAVRDGCWHSARPTPAAATSRKKCGASLSRCSAPSKCCAAACASTPPTTPTCSAPPSRPSVTRSRRSRKRDAERSDLQGSLVAMDPDDRRRARARRRPGLRREQLQPRHAGAAPGRIGVQADHLRRRARARLCAGIDAARSRRADCGPTEAWLPDGRARAERVHAAQRAEGLEQSRRGAAASAGRHEHGDLLRASARHRVGAAAGAVARARHRRGHAARADLRLRCVRESGAASSSPRFITRVEDADGYGDLVPRTTDTTRAISRTTAFLMSSMLSDVVIRRHRDRRARRGIQAAGGRKDRDDRRLRGRLVRRLHAAPRRRRLVRLRHARADHGSGVSPASSPCRHGRAS